MHVSFELSKEDFLQHQLFVASKSDSVKKQRQKSWWIMIALFGGLTIFFKFANNPLLFYYCLFFTVVSIIFYPIYLRKRYVKHYVKFIEENYKNRLGQTVTIDFLDESIQSGDVSGSSNINYSELQQITETGNYLYVKLKTIGYLIIPKRIENIEATKSYLKTLSSQMKIDYVEALDWQWK